VDPSNHEPIRELNHEPFSKQFHAEGFFPFIFNKSFLPDFHLLE